MTFLTAILWPKSMQTCSLTSHNKTLLMGCWIIWPRKAWSEYQSRSNRLDFRPNSTPKLTLVLTLLLVLKWHRLLTWAIQISSNRQFSLVNFQTCRSRSRSQILKTCLTLASCTLAQASLKKCVPSSTQVVQILGFSPKKAQRPWKKDTRSARSTRSSLRLSRSPRPIRSTGWKSVSEAERSEATSSRTKSWWAPLTTWTTS